MAVVQLMIDDKDDNYNEDEHEDDNRLITDDGDGITTNNYNDS